MIRRKWWIPLRPCPFRLQRTSAHCWSNFVRNPSSICSTTCPSHSLLRLLAPTGFIWASISPIRAWLIMPTSTVYVSSTILSSTMRLSLPISQYLSGNWLTGVVFAVTAHSMLPSSRVWEWLQQSGWDLQNLRNQFRIVKNQFRIVKTCCLLPFDNCDFKGIGYLCPINFWFKNPKQFVTWEKW